MTCMTFDMQDVKDPGLLYIPHGMNVDSIDHVVASDDHQDVSSILYHHRTYRDRILLNTNASGYLLYRGEIEENMRWAVHHVYEFLRGSFLDYLLAFLDFDASRQAIESFL